MATAAQIVANQNNAQSSTGPRTAEGKARSASNAVSFGLFSSRGFVRPEDIEEHDRLRAGLAEELRPDTIIEHVLAAQILHAMWRLRRCAQVEETLADCAGDIDPRITDPMANAETLPAQTAVDRARAQANVALRRSVAELRRLQTERFLRAQTPAAEGLVSHKEVVRTQLLARRIDGLHRFETILQQADRDLAAMVIRENTNQTQSGEAEELFVESNARVGAEFPVIPELDHVAAAV